MEDISNSLVLNVQELAKFLKISKSSAYDLTRRSDFPKVKINKRIVVPVEALKEWLRQNTL